ncbi:hypothetical protein [Saccharothrix sp. HUAS TT1]|uniref:hypothetical protein n=1 Tax=unclassified Saccharothrix TaxID=2593673 RepID=UPI00345BD76A
MTTAGQDDVDGGGRRAAVPAQPPLDVVGHFRETDHLVKAGWTWEEASAYANATSNRLSARIAERFGHTVDPLKPLPMLLITLYRNGEGTIHATTLNHPTSVRCGRTTNAERSGEYINSVLALVERNDAASAVTALRHAAVDPCRLCGLCFRDQRHLLPTEHGPGCAPLTEPTVTLTLSTTAVAVIAAHLSPGEAGVDPHHLDLDDAVLQELRTAFPPSAFHEWSTRLDPTT